MKRLLIPFLIYLLVGCNFSNKSQGLRGQDISDDTSQIVSSDFVTVPHHERWGIYQLKLGTQEIHLIFSSAHEISTLRLNTENNRFVFSMKTEENVQTSEEIFSILTNGQDLQRVTQNESWDLYPAWSPDGSEIAFLSQRITSLGVFIMNADGSNQRTLYDSSSHEADIDWVGDNIVFTKDSSIWIMNSDGSNFHQVSNPPRAGEWGNANLPFGDYDPRISPDGKKILFERLVDDQSPNGNYDFIITDIAGTNEIQITHFGYSQGLGSWSHSGDEIAYIVAAMGTTGKYHIFLMNSDGTNNRDITPDYFPTDFLSRWVVFSSDDASLYFIGEWWQD